MDKNEARENPSINEEVARSMGYLLLGTVMQALKDVAPLVLPGAQVLTPVKGDDGHLKPEIDVVLVDGRVLRYSMTTLTAEEWRTHG